MTARLPPGAGLEDPQQKFRHGRNQAEEAQQIG